MLKRISIFTSIILILSGLAITGCDDSSSDKSTAPNRVYGQGGDFTTNTVNHGGLSADSLSAPRELAVGSGGVYIADNGNNRVLYYTGTSTAPTRVYGQWGAFDADTANNGGITADSLYAPIAVAVDAGGVYIADLSNNRVLYYEGTSTTATRVYGQDGSFTSNIVNNGGISADSLNTPIGVTVVSGGVYIADYSNNRVLYYEGTSTTATRVYGQDNFTSNSANKGGPVSAGSLNAPSRVAVDAAGIYIVDRNNNRVLYYTGTSTTATRVYGQGGNFDTNTANNGGISADSLYNPRGIAIDSNGIYITDGDNNRVLYYPGTSTTATRVYGQDNFTSGTANNGGISADTLDYPAGVALSTGGIYIVDGDNNRVLWLNN